MTENCEITVRESCPSLHPADLPRIIEIYRTALIDVMGSQELVDSWLKQDSAHRPGCTNHEAATVDSYGPDKVVWVAEIEGDVVGYLAVAKVPEGQSDFYEYCLSIVARDPVFRGKGIGGKLGAAMLDKFGDKNIFVCSHDSPMHMRYYRSLGFEPSGQLVPFIGDVSLRYMSRTGMPK